MDECVYCHIKPRFYKCQSGRDLRDQQKGSRDEE